MNKINFCRIITNHINSFTSNGEAKAPLQDIIFHLIIPIVAAIIITGINGVIPNSVVGVLVNFGAITTALLMSAVVMVYDQKTKLVEKKEKETIQDKIKTLNKNISIYNELCNNICFAILTSILTVITALVLSFYTNTTEYKWFFCIITIFCYISFISTIVTFFMILKRFGIILNN